MTQLIEHWDDGGDDQDGLGEFLASLVLGFVKFVLYGWIFWPMRAGWRRLRESEFVGFVLLIGWVISAGWIAVFSRGNPDPDWCEGEKSS